MYQEDDDGPQLPQSVLDELRAALEQGGLQPEQVGMNHLRLELKSSGQVTSIALVSDLRLFFDPTASARKNVDRARSLQYHLDEDKRSELRKQLLWVVPPELSGHPELPVLRYMLEMDFRFALKRTCALGELAGWLVNPFATWPERALGPVRAQVLTRSPNSWEQRPPALVGTAELTVAILDAVPELGEQVHAHPKAAAIKSLAALLVQRILGAGYELAWEDEELQVKCPSAPSGLPLHYLGRGELCAVALCLLLAREHAQESRATCIRLLGAHNALDDVRHYRALLCLMDFIEATGASVEIETDHSSNRQLAQRFLTEAASLANKASGIDQ
ncbi:hypothetical protein D3C71_18880 [compost metagenome]